MLQYEYDSKSTEANILEQLIISREELLNGTSHLFRGEDHGSIPISFFWGRYSIGKGPKLHKHPYEEIHVIEEGAATFTLGDNTFPVGEDHVIITPANAPHKFINMRNETLKMISIHCSAKLISEYLDESAVQKHDQASTTV